jgi:hypothetical protein
MIRYLVVFLVVGNLALAVFIYQQEGKQAPAIQAPETGGDLQLLSEVDQRLLAELQPPPPPVPKEVPVEEETVSESALACYRYGPLNSRSGVKKLKQALADHEVKVALHEESKEPVSRYFVVLDRTVHSQPDDPQLLEQMKPLGLEEVWRIRSGPLKGEYSLGMFSKESYAASLVSQLAALGVTAKQAERKLETKDYWLDISLPATQDAAALFPQDLAGELKPRECVEE